MFFYIIPFNPIILSLIVSLIRMKMYFDDKVNRCINILRVHKKVDYTIYSEKCDHSCNDFEALNRYWGKNVFWRTAK